MIQIFISVSVNTFKGISKETILSVSLVQSNAIPFVFLVLSYVDPMSLDRILPAITMEHAICVPALMSQTI